MYYRILISLLVVQALLARVSYVLGSSNEDAITLDFTKDHAKTGVGSTKSFAVNSNIRFIGDLIIGESRYEENAFAQPYEFNNPTDQVHVKQINLRVRGESIHFMSAINSRGDRAAICGNIDNNQEVQSLYARFPPMGKTTLQLTVASHRRWA